MAREHLSARARQPGHDTTFRTSEANFAAVLEKLLNPDLFEIEQQPRELTDLFPPIDEDAKGRPKGVVPEVGLTFKPTGRKIFFEVKKQGPRGNAEERACKHHTVQFVKCIRDRLGYDYHPFVVIMCENLATDFRYLQKHPYFFEPDNYFCWADYEDVSSLRAYLDRVIHKWLGCGQGAPVFRENSWK